MPPPPYLFKESKEWVQLLLNEDHEAIVNQYLPENPFAFPHPCTYSYNKAMGPRYRFTFENGYSCSIIRLDISCQSNNWYNTPVDEDLNYNDDWEAAIIDADGDFSLEEMVLQHLSRKEVYNILNFTSNLIPVITNTV